MCLLRPAPTRRLPPNTVNDIDPGLLRVLRQLPRRQREVIAVRVFLDLDTRATAELLGISEGTVKAHLSRAVATLRVQLIAHQTEVLP